MTELKQFCSSTLQVIQPDVVMVTGDLTDAKYPNMIGSNQFEEEWKTYNDVLEETKAAEKYVWLDIRGNHGNKL